MTPEECLERHAGLVKYVVDTVARRLPPWIDREDVESEATIGLLDALERFDSARGLKFETYARHRVRGTVIDWLRSIDPVTRTKRRKAIEIDKVRRTLEQELGRHVTDEEIADRMGMCVSRLRNVIRDVDHAMTASLDFVVCTSEDEQPLTLIETIADADIRDFEADADIAEMKHVLRQIVEMLNDRERAIIAMRYECDMTFGTIGDRMGLCEARISQIHAAAIAKLRRMFESLGLAVKPSWEIAA